MKKRADGLYQKKIIINGKPKFFYGKTVAEINKKVLAYQEKAERGATFKEVATEWEKQHLKEVPYTTYKKCGITEFNTAVDTFGEQYIQKISAKDIDDYLHKLAARGYSQKTVSSYKSIVNQIFKYAVLNSEITNNPVAVISIPKNLPKKKRTLPSTKDIKIISGLTEGFGFLGCFLIYTGLRISEALALTYEDIDFNSKMINIDKKVVFDGNTPLLRHETKTAAGTRKVILLDRIAEMLPKNKHGLVFGNSNREHYTRKQVRSGWDKVRKDNNVTATLHQLRHAYATMLFEAGVNEKDTQHLMGHSNITITREIYTHIRKERMDETANKLNAFNF